MKELWDWEERKEPGGKYREHHPAVYHDTQLVLSTLFAKVLSLSI
jgi:hypothetical protein